MNALSQRALNDKIREADRINEVMKEKIANGPGLQNFGGYCYGTAESLEQCINDMTDEMQPTKNN